MTVSQEAALVKADTTTPEGDTFAAVEFLRSLDEGGRHNLVAFDPQTTDIEGRTFEPGEWQEIERWIDARNGRKNLYFSLNEPRAGAPHGKLRKEHIGRIRAVGVDIDPKKGVDASAERERLDTIATGSLDHVLFPSSAAIDSGNGVQMWWMLASPVDASDSAGEAEAVGAALKTRFGGDAVQNIDRLYRLPGTVNIPDAKKKALGRVPRLARLLGETAERHTLEDLAKWTRPKAAPAKPQVSAPVDIDMGLVNSVASWDDVPAATRAKFDALLGSDPRFARLWDGDRTAYPGSDDSRSGLAFVLAGVSRRAGLTATEYGMIMRAWPLADPEASERDLTRAWANCGVFSAGEEFEAVEVADQPPVPAALPVHNVASFGWSGVQNYAVKGFINFGMIGFVSGLPNAGKSPLVMDLLAHVAQGWDWLGRRVRRSYALYLSTEGWTGISNRMEAARREYFAGAENVPLDFLAAPLNLRTTTRDADAIIKTVHERSANFGLPPGLIAIDTLSHTLAGGDDSNQEHVRAVIANAQRIVKATGAAMLIVHHPTKDGSSDSRGSSLLTFDTDLLIKVEVDAKTRRRRVTTPRVKEYAQMAPAEFDLKVVDLGKDQDGDAITSIVVSWRPDAEDEFDDKITDNARQVRDALQAAIAAKKATNATNATYSEWLAALKVGCIGDAPNPNTLRSRLQRGRAELMHLGVIEKDNEDQYVIVS